MLFYCVLTSMVLYKKSLVIWIIILLDVMCHLSLTTFKICSLFIVFSSLITMCVGRTLFEFAKFMIGICWAGFFFFHQVWEYFGHYFFKCFFCPDRYLLSFRESNSMDFRPFDGCFSFAYWFMEFFIWCGC